MDMVQVKMKGRQVPIFIGNYDVVKDDESRFVIRDEEGSFQYFSKKYYTFAFLKDGVRHV